MSISLLNNGFYAMLLTDSGVCGRGGVSVGQPISSESDKFIISDPTGNLIEFKYYLDFANSVG